MADEKAEQPPELGQYHYFSTPVYIAKKPEFIDIVREVAEEKLAEGLSLKGGKVDKLFPVIMSTDMLGDDRIAEFATYLGETAWNILADQGYAMDGFSTVFQEMWCQEHGFSSSMDYHAHGGSHIVGFYFLDTPKGCPHAIIHDPRPSKMMLPLPETDGAQATLASTMINFKPEPGMVMFAPSYLPHSFGRNAAKKPFRFVHFNIGVQPIAPALCAAPTAEII